MTKHMEGQIEKLKKKILTLSAIVEQSVRQAVDSVSKRDRGMATEIIERDVEIDHMELDVEEECLKILALYQPVATDLRFVVSVMKINNDLERVGDLAVNIAERTVFLASADPITIPFDFRAMAEKSQAMLGKSLDALMNKDTTLAHEVLASDDEVDALNREMYHLVHDGIRAQPEKVKEYVNLLSVTRHLERIADYATNIAEDVIYMRTGEIIRHKPDAVTSAPPPDLGADSG